MAAEAVSEALAITLEHHIVVLEKLVRSIRRNEEPYRVVYAALYYYAAAVNEEVETERVETAALLLVEKTEDDLMSPDLEDFPAILAYQRFVNKRMYPGREKELGEWGQKWKGENPPAPILYDITVGLMLGEFIEDRVPWSLGLAHRMMPAGYPQQGWEEGADLADEAADLLGRTKGRKRRRQRIVQPVRTKKGKEEEVVYAGVSDDDDF